MFVRSTGRYGSTMLSNVLNTHPEVLRLSEFCGSLSMKALASNRSRGPIDTTTPAGRLVFGIFAVLAEFERELIRERTLSGLEAARAKGRKGGRKFALTKAQVRLARAATKSRDTSVAELAAELHVKPVTLYRCVGPTGDLRAYGKRVLNA